MSSAGPRPRSPSAKGGLPGRASNRRSEIEAARLQDQNLELQENVVRLNADLAARMRFQRRAQTDGDVAQAQAQARSSTLQEERDDALARCTSLQGSFDEKLRVERAERGGLAGKVRELEADLGLEQQLAAQLQEELQAAREGDEARRRELDRAHANDQRNKCARQLQTLLANDADPGGPHSSSFFLPLLEWIENRAPHV